MYIPQTVEPHPKSKVQVNIFIYRTHVCIYHKLLSLILNLRYKSTYLYKSIHNICMYIPQTVEPHPKSKVQVNIFIYRTHVCIYHKLLSLILNLRYKSTYLYNVHMYVYTTNC